MAHRIDEVLVRGEIDNTQEGKTTGWLWLLGRSEPVTLDLVGDCWRDLAGARLKFRNQAPRRGAGEELSRIQKGVVGDMTASRKAKVPDCPLDEFAARCDAGEDVPLVWKNSLYLEWFSDVDGRVVIETTDFELELSDNEWRMDSDAEEAQKLANLQAMRDFLEGVIGRRPATPEGGRPKDDEFEWEERLKESDRLTDAYQEVLEKYMDDPDAEQKEAFVMGWDGLLEAMAAESEGKGSVSPDWLDEDSEEDDEPESESWMDEDDDPFKAHPLQLEAHELAMRSYDLVREDSREIPDACELTSALTKVAAKLAGALNGTYERETGYILAILKRCQQWLNEALAACRHLIELESDNDKERALESLRDEVFLLRQRLTDLRKELKGS
ncbi:hypothetical protein ACFQY0_14385 [Haloferula chungangensis]|uniref:Uncharacterized protein n=1 Tax=Haloferula chungangensis TaxID=1048331 RepID=A0ABW2L9J8_9BACT